MVTKGLTAVLKYASEQCPALRGDVEHYAWWRFCRLWVRIALVKAERNCDRWHAAVGASPAGRRDEPAGLRGPRACTACGAPAAPACAYGYCPQRRPSNIPPGVPDPFAEDERKRQLALVEGGCHAAL